MKLWLARITITNKHYTLSLQKVRSTKDDDGDDAGSEDGILHASHWRTAVRRLSEINGPTSLSYERIMCTNELIKCVCVLVFDILLTNLYETNN